MASLGLTELFGSLNSRTSRHGHRGQKDGAREQPAGPAQSHEPVHRHDRRDRRASAAEERELPTGDPAMDDRAVCDRDDDWFRAATVAPEDGSTRLRRFKVSYARSARLRGWEPARDDAEFPAASSA
jgi:hypothetical protein